MYPFVESSQPRSGLAARPPSRNALLVVGMGRSGTSALTRVLSLCGAGLPAHVMPGNPSNELGHWEPQRIVDAHDAFLSSVGSSWLDLNPLPLADASIAPKVSGLSRQLAALIEEEYRGIPLLVVKDPRMARLLPIWREVLRSLEITPFAIIPIRDPVEVARSLESRDGADPDRSLLLWLRYTLAAERDSRGMARCFVSYESLLEDWRSVVGVIATKSGFELPAVPEEVASEIGRFLRRDLRHQTHSLDGRGRLARVPTLVGRAYALFAGATRGAELDLQAVEALAVEVDAAWDALGSSLVHAEACVSTLSQRLAASEGRAADAEGRLAAVADLLREANGTLHVARAEADRSTAEVNELRAEAARLAEQLAQAQSASVWSREQAEAERAHRSGMESSLSWTLTGPVRRTAARFPGLGSQVRALALRGLGYARPSGAGSRGT